MPIPWVFLDPADAAAAAIEVGGEEAFQRMARMNIVELIILRTDYT